MPTTLIGTALEILKQHGVTAVIALGLIWLIGFRLDAKLDRVDTTLTDHLISTQTLLVTLTHQAQQDDQQLAIMQRICLNTAKTDQDRLSCVVLPK